jgi:hypothetical protein
MPYAIEFPDFDPATMPAIPDGFSDWSWRNDTCPMFVHEASGVALWIDFADVAQREYDDCPRFSAVALDHDAQHGWQKTGDAVTLFETDDWSTVERSLPAFVQPRAIAKAFADNLRDELTGLQFTLMRLRNRTYAEDGRTAVCASHEYCDANIPMSAAFEAVMGRPVLPAFGEMADADVALWNEAWSIASRLYLTADARARRITLNEGNEA